MIRALHYTAAALFVAPILAHATGLTPGVEDPRVAQFYRDLPVIAGSPLALDGVPVRLHDPTVTHCSPANPCDAQTTTPVPLPLGGVLLVSAVGALAMMKRRR